MGKSDCKKMTEDNNMFKENLYRMKAENETIRKNVKRLRKNLDQLELDITGIKENEIAPKEFDLENLKKYVVDLEKQKKMMTKKVEQSEKDKLNIALHLDDDK